MFFRFLGLHIWVLAVALAPVVFVVKLAGAFVGGVL